MNTLQIRVSESAKIGRVEKDIYLYLKDKDFSQPLIIDLSEVRFIQPPATLVFLAQFIYKRHIKGLKTSIKPPISNEVRNILFTWRFYEIIEDLTGKQIYFFMDEKINRFPPSKFELEGKTYYLDINRDYFDKYYREDQVKKLVKKGFFSLICEPFKETNQKNLALKRQTRTWSTEKLITDVLQQNLLEIVSIGNLLPNTIIFECLTNAANHPSSDHFVIGSFYDFTNSEDLSQKPKNTPDYFTIVIWDDGDSIINTLLKSIYSGLNVRATESFELAKKSGYRSWFRIVRENYESNKNIEFLYYDYLPEIASPLDEVLLSSFLPGISRLPAVLPNNDDQEDLSNEEIDHDSGDRINYLSGTGMGLTYLLKAVTKDLNGSIHIRTDNYLLEFTRARKGGGIESNDMLFFKKLNKESNKEVDFFCKAKLRQYPSDVGCFLGNMITVKIPLKH